MADPRPLVLYHGEISRAAVQLDLFSSRPGAPRVPVIMNQLTESQKGYIAGILDGEGHLGLSKKKDHTGMRRGYAYRPTVSVANTKEELLWWLRDTTGLGAVNRKSLAQHLVRNKPSWAWSTWSRQSGQLLAAVAPYLVIKRKQADLLLGFIERTSLQKGGSLGLTDEQALVQEQTYIEMAILNKRGR